MKKNTKKFILYGLGAVFAVALVSLIAGGKEAKTDSVKYSASSLSVLERAFDFGTIKMYDGEVFHKFEIKNEGAEPVKIEKVYTSCMCTTAYITKESGERYGKFGMPGHGVVSGANIVVEPGTSMILDAIFDPAAHGPSGTGFIQRSVYLETNSAKAPKLEFSFQAVVAR